MLCATDDTTSWSFARQTIYTTGATIYGIGPWVGSRARETPIRSISAIVTHLETGAFSLSRTGSHRSSSLSVRTLDPAISQLMIVTLGPQESHSYSRIVRSYTVHE